MRLLCTILIGVIFSSCHSQNRTIAFINQSEVEIDSMWIGVASADVYAIKYVKIKPSDTVIALIPHNKPKSNKHDIRIEITIYIKNHDLIYWYNYNDLAGYLDEDYTIVLDKRKEVKLIPGSKKRY